MLTDAARVSSQRGGEALYHLQQRPDGIWPIHKRVNPGVAASKAAALEAQKQTALSAINQLQRPYARSLVQRHGMSIKYSPAGNPIFFLPGQSKHAYATLNPFDREYKGLDVCADHLILTNDAPAKYKDPVTGAAVPYSTSGWYCDNDGCMASGKAGTTRAHCHLHATDYCFGCAGL